MKRHIRHMSHISQDFSYTKHITRSEVRAVVASLLLLPAALAFAAAMPSPVQTLDLMMITEALATPRHHVGRNQGPCRRRWDQLHACAATDTVKPFFFSLPFPWYG